MDAAGKSSDLLADLLRLEARSAQLDAALEADPELGMAWRAQMSLAEAAASVRLEDVAVFEGDILVREIEGRAVSDDVMRGIAAAEGLLQVLGRPGSMDQDPEAVAMRCWDAGQVQPETDIVGGDACDPADRPMIPAGLGGEIRTAADDAPTAFLAALRGACILRRATFTARPASERLAFMMCEHRWRGGKGRSIEPIGGRLVSEEAISRISARWVMLPSLSLSSRGFTAWSPLSEAGMEVLLSRLSRQISRDMGSLPILRRWRSKAEALGRGRHGRSRARDLAASVISRPVVSGASLAGDLGITPRGALNLISEAVEAGVLAPLVARRTWRCWAATPLAEVLRSRSISAGRPAAHPWPGVEEGERDVDGQGGDAEAAITPPSAARMSQDEIAAREARVFERLDAAMAQADAILRKYGGR